MYLALFSSILNVDNLSEKLWCTEIQRFVKINIILYVISLLISCNNKLAEKYKTDYIIEMAIRRKFT